MSHELNAAAIGAEPDPLRWFDRWYTEARRGPAEPSNAMVLSTLDEAGRPDARVVLLAQVDAGGFIFMSNYESRKGQQLATSPQAALVFHWPDHGRQVRARGPAVQIDAAASDVYFAGRPRASQIGAWASDQSRPLPGGTGALEQRVAQATARFEGKDVRRPSHWGGYRLEPWEMELWQSGPHRLHTRYRFTRVGPQAPWSSTLLNP